MMSNETGSGGFFLPRVYKKNQSYVQAQLIKGEVDYAELSRWTFPDEFFSFILDTDLLKFVDATYPTPRTKQEVPIWFIIHCQFLMHLYQRPKYSHLNYLLNAGALLSRVGFNIGTTSVGFNQKNKYPRNQPLCADTVRKFFKDTEPSAIREWFGVDVQRWFQRKKTFHSAGRFILDQTHIVVPRNAHYKDAVMMPVDEQGHFYKHLSELSPEAKAQLPHHPCYTLSTLLHVGPDQSTFHVADYEFGPGNEDELPQADTLIERFCRQFPGVMKELIVDRGYIDKKWIEKIKKDYQVDTLIPLRESMTLYQDALRLAAQNAHWQLYAHCQNEKGQLLEKMEVAYLKDFELWTSEQCKQSVAVSKVTRWSETHEEYRIHYYVLASTKNYANATDMVRRYRQRVQIEERFRQFKGGWSLSQFPSPNRALMESHLCFTFFTYSLLQLYLRREDLREKTHQFIQTLQQDERLGRDNVLVYAGNHYGVFNLTDYTTDIIEMEPSPGLKLKATMETQKQHRIGH